MLSVGVVRFVGSLWMLVVSASIKESNWPDLGVVTSTSSFKLFSGMPHFAQPRGLMVKDCKPALRAMMPQPIFLERVTRSSFEQRVVIRVLQLAQCTFKLRRATYNWTKKMINMVLDVILFLCWSFCVLLPFHCTMYRFSSIAFNYKMLLVSLNK